MHVKAVYSLTVSGGLWWFLLSPPTTQPHTYHSCRREKVGSMSRPIWPSALQDMDACRPSQASQALSTLSTLYPPGRVQPKLTSYMLVNVVTRAAARSWHETLWMSLMGPHRSRMVSHRGSPHSVPPGPSVTRSASHPI